MKTFLKLRYVHVITWYLQRNARSHSSLASTGMRTTLCLSGVSVAILASMNDEDN